MDRYDLNDLSNFLDGVVDQNQQKQAIKSDEFGYFEDDFGVIYKPLRCSRCQSKKVHCYRTINQDTFIVRYHTCQICGKNFKSIEEK